MTLLIHKFVCLPLTCNTVNIFDVYSPSPLAPFCWLRCVQSERTYEDYMSYLAPMEIAIRHVAALTLLGSIHHTE